MQIDFSQNGEGLEIVNFNSLPQVAKDFLSLLLTENLVLNIPGAPHFQVFSFSQENDKMTLTPVSPANL